MKLEERVASRRPGRARSAEIIRPPEDLPDRIFDPRLDLYPGAYEEIRNTVKRESSFKGPKIFRIPRLSWISWFDPSYRDDLRGVEHYKERQTEELSRQADLAKRTPGNLVQLNREAAYFLQQFPEARTDIDSFTTNKERALSMMMATSTDEKKEALVKDHLVIWLQLWPQHRKEIVNRFFPEGLEPLIASPDALNWLHRPTERIHYAAQIMLAFPEHRDHVLKLVQPLVKNIRGILETLAKGIDRDSFNEYHQLIGDLTIIGAKGAVIDQSGIIQVELQPVHKPSAVPPLPDRSTL